MTETSLPHETVGYVDVTVRVRIDNLAKLRRGMQECYQQMPPRDGVREFLASKAIQGLQHVDGVLNVTEIIEDPSF